MSKLDQWCSLLLMRIFALIDVNHRTRFLLSVPHFVSNTIKDPSILIYGQNETNAWVLSIFYFSYQTNESFNLKMISLIVVLTVIFIIVFKIYWSSIRPSKRIYDYLREQGVPSEPFVPIVGQLPEIRRFREQGHLIEFHEKLTKKHGKTYLFGLGPYPRLVIQDVDYLRDRKSVV